MRRGARKTSRFKRRFSDVIGSDRTGRVIQKMGHAVLGLSDVIIALGRADHVTATHPSKFKCSCARFDFYFGVGLSKRTLLGSLGQKMSSDVSICSRCCL